MGFCRFVYLERLFLLVFIASYCVEFSLEASDIRGREAFDGMTSVERRSHGLFVFELSCTSFVLIR